MTSANLDRQISKPKTQRGRRFLSKREPQIYENDKQTLIIKGAHTSEIVNAFMTDFGLLKKPLANKLKWKNRVLPFEDASFIERMCEKQDCSLFVFGMHSKKRPHNIVIGRLHDHEILDMVELGIERYASIRSTDVKLSLGAKPLLIFSGEAFEESEESRHLKSLLIDLFRGPKVTKVNSAGIEHVIHFVMPSEGKLIMRVHAVDLRRFQSDPEQENVAVDVEDAQISEPLKTPWGQYVQLELRNAASEADFVIRRCKMPSEDKWKRACRVPSQLRPKTDKSSKNRSMDVFGSKVAQVHVQREHALDELRPAASMRTALTGNVKRGFDRQQQPTKKRKSVDGASKAKRQRLNIDNE